MLRVLRVDSYCSLELIIIQINERIVLDEMIYSQYRSQNLREPPKPMTRSALLPADDLTALSRLKDDELRTCQALIGGYVLGMEKYSLDSAKRGVSPYPETYLRSEYVLLTHDLGGGNFTSISSEMLISAATLSTV